MSVRLAAIFAGVMLCGLVLFGGDVGTTSRWGIVVMPCAWCGTSNNIEVHHVYPQHEYPELRYNTNYMVYLCRKDGKGCHYYIGRHGKGWEYVFTNLFKMLKSLREGGE